MSQEIVDAVRSLAREKGISEDKLLHALEDALLSAYKKQPGAARYARVTMDPELGEYRVEELLLPEDLEDQLLDEAARSVRFSAPGVELSFGAVGKGFALDRVTRSLQDRGLGRALVSAGGSSQRGWGGQQWELALEPARREIGRLRFEGAALATSGAGEQYFEENGRRYGHVLDPRTGWPAEGVRSATVLASEAAVADALSTAFLVAGPELARSVCAARPGTLALLVLDARPDEILAVGSRDGVSVEPAAGVRLVHRSPEAEPLHPD